MTFLPARILALTSNRYCRPSPHAAYELISLWPSSLFVTLGKQFLSIELWSAPRLGEVSTMFFLSSDEDEFFPFSPSTSLLPFPRGTCVSSHSGRGPLFPARDAGHGCIRDSQFPFHSVELTSFLFASSRARRFAKTPSFGSDALRGPSQ